jgi:hypothetical protein
VGRLQRTNALRFSFAYRPTCSRELTIGAGSTWTARAARRQSAECSWIGW